MTKQAIFCNGAVIEIDPSRILTNNVIMPHEYNPHVVKPWLIESLYGPCGVVWASSEDDAIDILVDAELGKSLEIDHSEAFDAAQQGNEIAYCGNNGTPCDLTNCSISAIDLTLPQNRELAQLMQEAGELCLDNLSQLISCLKPENN
jgi:hypothetical protein